MARSLGLVDHPAFQTGVQIQRPREPPCEIIRGGYVVPAHHSHLIIDLVFEKAHHVAGVVPDWVVAKRVALSAAAFELLRCCAIRTDKGLVGASEHFAPTVDSVEIAGEIMSSWQAFCLPPRDFIQLVIDYPNRIVAGLWDLTGSGGFKRWAGSAVYCGIVR